MGKTARKKLAHIMTDTIDLPKEIKEIHNKVAISGDLMFINTNPFMVSMARNKEFITLQRPLRKAKSNLHNAIKNMYRRWEVCLTMLLMGRKFLSLVSSLAKLGVKLNTTSRSESVSKMERVIRLIKEHV
eukprot:15354339-Ditylum_brightwellii.AAC.1